LRGGLGAAGRWRHLFPLAVVSAPVHVAVLGPEADVVRAHCHLSAQALIDTIFADLDRFNRVLFDDQTLVVMKVK
jgi:hypothetical protein